MRALCAAHWHVLVYQFGAPNVNVILRHLPNPCVQLRSHIAGLFRIWQLQAVMVKACIYAFQVPSKETGDTFLEYGKLTSDRFSFMASLKTNVARSYYSMPELPELPSLRTTVCLGHIGTSSLSAIATLNCADSGEVYVQSTNQVVSIDKSTRRPSPLPEWWRTKYASSVVGNKRLMIPRFSQPDSVHLYECRVPYSDVDFNGHTNFAAYIRYCIDCGTDGVYTGAYSNFTDALSRYYIKDMSISFYNESNANDALQISSWEDEENTNILKFNGTNNGKTIFQSSIEFYPVEEASS